MKKVMILGVEISDLSQTEALKIARQWLAGSGRHYILTPNPEIVLTASKNAKLRFVFDKADLSLPDGFGLKIAARVLGQKLRHRVAGADFMLQIAALAAQESRGIFLLGGEEGVAQKAAARLREMFPGIKILGAASGGEVKKIGTEWKTSDSSIIQKINQSQAEILFIAFGCPKQEKWLFHNLSKLSTIRLAMTVGGSLDFLAGKTKRAPKKIRQLGMEWLWRLFHEPARLPRIWNATFYFLWKVMLAKFRIKFIYRRNVVGFITRHSERSPAKRDEVEESQNLATRPLDFARGDGTEVLLVQRANEKYEHWQLPQGGVDKGESEKEAVLREMREEIGAAKLKILGQHPQKYSYDWSRWHQLRGSYRGQRQTIFYLRFDPSRDSIKLDEHEIKAYRWLPLEQAPLLVHAKRRDMVKMAVEGFQQFRTTIYFQLHDYQG